MLPSTPITPDTRPNWARYACAFAAGGFILPPYWIMELFSVPPGAAIRPMGLGAAFLVTLVTPLIVAPFGVLAICERGASRTLGILALLASVVPLPLYWALVCWIVDSRALIIEP